MNGFPLKVDGISLPSQPMLVLRYGGLLYDTVQWPVCCPCSNYCVDDPEEHHGIERSAI